MHASTRLRARLIAALVSALVVVAFVPRARAQVRIAVVDLQRAVGETADGRRARRRMGRLVEERQAEIERRQHELEELAERARAPGLSEEARRERAEAAQAHALELQQRYAQYQRELAERESELLSRIVERMQRILRRMGQTEGYTAILERSQGRVVFADESVDLTSTVVERYERGEGREGEDATRPPGEPHEDGADERPTRSPERPADRVASRTARDAGPRPRDAGP